MFSDFQDHVIGVPQIAPQLTNNSFDGPGANEDFGAEQITKDPQDRYKFRTSPLRNMAVQPTFMHNGAFTSLADAVIHHLDVIESARAYTPANQHLDADLAGPSGPIDPVLARIDPILATPISFTSHEIYQLIAFVENGLLDPRAKPDNLRRLVPRSVPSGRPVLIFDFPSNRTATNYDHIINGQGFSPVSRQMSYLLDRILETLPPNWHMDSIHIGLNWTVSVVQNQAGQRRAGLAATPAPERVAAQSQLQYGPNQPAMIDATSLARCAQASDPVEAAVGLATLNALLQPDPAQLAHIDAADWLVSHGRGRKVALVGRFPFIDELKPVIAQLWVLELNPQPGEYSANQAPLLIPQADVVAITSSTLVNHTLAGLLALARPEAKVMLLGPSTPLTPILFEFGVDLLSGVQVVDLEAILASVTQSVNFQKMQGVRRVTMAKI